RMTSAPTLFPYTTLFRSGGARRPRPGERQSRGREERADALPPISLRQRSGYGRPRPVPALEAFYERGEVGGEPRGLLPVQGVPRSEEHTSELQSRENLVC